MREVIRFLAIGWLLAMPLSCVEPIDLNPREGRSLVVNCILTESDVQTLEMYYTSAEVGGEREQVVDAKVTLYCVYDQVAEFHRCEDGLWRADYRPQYGLIHRLNITVGGMEYHASTIFPNDIKVDTYGRIRKSETGRQGQDYLMYSYELRLYDKKDLNVYWGRDCLLASHLWIFPRDLGWGKDFQEYIATSHFCADDFNLTSLCVRDLSCFSSDSINVMEPWLRRQLAWYPVKLAELPLHQAFVRIDIPENYHSGQAREELTNSPVYSDMSFALARAFPTSWPDYDGPYRKSVYDIYILSREADSYFKDVYRHHLNKDYFLFEYDTENIYSNIYSGSGVFGAMVLRHEKPGVIGYLGD